jgi:hypothetical protein
MDLYEDIVSLKHAMNAYLFMREERIEKESKKFKSDFSFADSGLCPARPLLIIGTRRYLIKRDN